MVGRSYGYDSPGSYLYLLDYRGNLLWEKYIGENLLIEGIAGYSLGDINGDAKKEIVAATTYCVESPCYAKIFKAKIYVLNISGNILPGWPKEFKGMPSRAPIFNGII